ncbi:hypothetical protein EMCRGX_G033027 [Ephydatia muelleri]
MKSVPDLSSRCPKWFSTILVKNSRVQEPNVETDHLESSTSGSVNLLNQSFDTRFQPTRQDVCWSRGHALLHQVVQNQPDGQMGEHSHLRASAPPFYPWYSGAMWLQSSQYSTHIGAAMYSSCQNRPSH